MAERNRGNTALIQNGIDADSEISWNRARQKVCDLLAQRPLYTWVTETLPDGGVKFWFASQAGAGYGEVPGWPLLRFDGFAQEIWDSIRARIQDFSLEMRDLRGTRLSGFAKEVSGSWLNESAELWEIFQGILDLPDEVPEQFYVLFPTKYGEILSIPDFYMTEEELLAAFQDLYCRRYVAWDAMSAMELSACEEAMRKHNKIRIFRYGHL